MSIFEDGNPQDYWEKQKPIYKEILESSFQEFADKLPIQMAFRLGDRSLRCIGEGTVGGLHLAASGLLLGEEGALRFIEEARVDGVYSHSGCVAALSYTEQAGLDTKKSDKIAEDWAEKIAQRSGVPFLGHIGLLELKRPSAFHIARVVYYDGTGRFDYSHTGDLPPGFTISRRYLSPEYAKLEIEQAVKIITGEQGFGELVTKKDPLVLLAISNDSDGNIDLSQLESELTAIAEGYNGLAVVQTLAGKI